MPRTQPLDVDRLRYFVGTFCLARQEINSYALWRLCIRVSQSVLKDVESGNKGRSELEYQAPPSAHLRKEARPEE